MVYKAISSLKIKVELKPVVDNLVFRLHYRYTYIIFMASCLLATLYDAIGIVTLIPPVRQRCIR